MCFWYWGGFFLVLPPLLLEPCQFRPTVQVIVRVLKGMWEFYASRKKLHLRKCFSIMQTFLAPFSEAAITGFWERWYTGQMGPLSDSVCYFLISNFKCPLKQRFQICFWDIDNTYSLPQDNVFRETISIFFGKYSFSADHSCAVCLLDYSLLLYVHLSIVRQMTFQHFILVCKRCSNLLEDSLFALYILRQSWFFMLRVPWKRLGRKRHL